MINYNNIIVRSLIKHQNTCKFSDPPGPFSVSDDFFSDRWTNGQTPWVKKWAWWVDYDFKYKTRVINDPLRSDHLNFFFHILKSGDGWTDDMCNKQWLWIGLVDQKYIEVKFLRVVQSRMIEVMANACCDEDCHVQLVEDGVKAAAMDHNVHHLSHAEAMTEIVERIGIVRMFHFQLKFGTSNYWTSLVTQQARPHIALWLVFVLLVSNNCLIVFWTDGRTPRVKPMTTYQLGEYWINYSNEGNPTYT